MAREQEGQSGTCYPPGPQCECAPALDEDRLVSRDNRFNDLGLEEDLAIVYSNGGSLHDNKDGGGLGI